MYFVYILYSPSADRYYVGQTDHLDVRLQHHNNGDVTSTKPYRPWQLQYYETYDSRSEAMRRERQIKAQKSRKYLNALIAQKVQLAESREAGLITGPSRPSRDLGSHNKNPEISWVFCLWRSACSHFFSARRPFLPLAPWELCPPRQSLKS